MREPINGRSPEERLRQLSLAQIRELRARSAAKEARLRPPPLTAQQRDKELPLSFAQERLWFLDQLGVAGPAYNSQVAVELQGRLDIQALDRGLGELIRRHEILRTRFEAIDGKPVQMVESSMLFSMIVLNLSDLQEAQRELQVRMASKAEAEGAFDLITGPLIRVALLTLGKERHLLFITAHHIITDGWSWEVLRNELGALYSAYAQNMLSALPDLPIQYKDYAIWQRQWLKGEVLESQLAYWRERLAGAPAELELPTDRPRGPTATSSGARIRFNLKRELRRALEELAKREGVTLFMTILAAYQVMLSRYSRQQDVLVGCPIAGRSHPRTEALIGFFINTLVLRTDLSGNPSFRELLQRVKTISLGAYAHQDLPFEKLVMDLHPDRNLARQPIFQVALAMQNYPRDQMEWTGLSLMRAETEQVSTIFDITLNIAEINNELTGAFVYAKDLFDATRIERMAGHFLALLQEMTDDPNSRIEDACMISATERLMMLREFNNTAALYPKDGSIHELFEDQVRQAPNSIAVRFESEFLTYSELNAKANQLAWYLKQQGAQTGEFIPLLMPRCEQMLIAQLAILKIGCAYVPMDPSFPLDRLAFMIRDCGAIRAITDSDCYAAIDKLSVVWIKCSLMADVIGSFPPQNLGVPMIGQSPAYVMYTSGSTGVPKGVVVSHRAVIRLAINNGYAEISSVDCVAHCSNPAFDASTFEVWGALLNGARVIVVPQAVLMDGQSFSDALTREQVTVLWLTVGLFTQYVEALAPVLPQIRYLLTGGDIVDPGLVGRVLEAYPLKHLINAYGPTECTTFSSTYCVDAHKPPKGSTPIGRPISNAQIYLLSEHLRLTPLGVNGEIHVGGAGVAIGYLNRPALTAERFIADPFSEHTGARLYRSGDLARWRVDGVIDFAGRNDQQVKFRGFRIEMGEVEERLLQHPQVRTAVVVLRENKNREKQIVAYITERAGGRLEIADLRAQVETDLPEYMVPSAFVVLEKLPLTQNGKVDRNALPAPEAGAYVHREYEAPKGVLEERLAGIWKELLGLERVGRRDNFFDLGGHSLLVLKAVFMINRSFEKSLSVKNVYVNPTLQELAAHIRRGSVEVDQIDWRAEATLHDDVVAIRGQRCNPAATVLMTGATGFVGRFLLAHLLEATNATIHCVVRAPSEHQANVRLRSVLSKWDLWRDEFESRVLAVPGDLALPRLGVGEAAYAKLSECVESIYHCGVSMNHLETYTMARAANVDATRELVKVAATGRPKVVNYISTLSVFTPSADGISRIVDETSEIAEEKHLASRGYAASKWVAEGILADAQRKGVSCNIFRLGLVWADSSMGRYDDRQRSHRILKSSLISNLGIREYQCEMAPTPVDYVVRAIVHLAESHSEGGRVFHLSSPAQMSDGLFERCNEIAGTSLKLLSFYGWIQEMKRLHFEGRTLPIVPLIEFAFSMSEEEFNEHWRRNALSRVIVDCSRTHRELERAGIVAPVLTDEMLRRLLEDMVARDGDFHERLKHKEHMPLSPGGARASLR